MTTPPASSLMGAGEYEAMAAVEARHWWYHGLRGAVRAALARPALGLPTRPRVLDAGCGTGENLGLLNDLLRPSYLAGFDLSEQALAITRRKVGGSADLYLGDVCAPDVREGELDLITSFDVLCTTGLAAARDGVRRLRDALRPGGLFMLNIPAYEWLRSEHDVAVVTTERATAGRIRRYFGEVGLEAELLSYRVCLLFPAMVASRLSRRAPASGAATSDLQRPPGPVVNEVLRRVMAAENALLAGGLSLPFGGSVFAVGRRPAG